MATTSRRTMLRAALVTTVAVAATTGWLLVGAHVAAAGPDAGPVRSATLESGEELTAGEEIESANGAYTLRMQTDGNLSLLDEQEDV
ncbi:MAG: hypothetical protein ACRDQ0_18155, partial [Pseudonocardia sp.]